MGTKILYGVFIAGAWLCVIGLYCLGKWWTYRQSTKTSQPAGMLGLTRELSETQVAVQEDLDQKLPGWLATQARYGWSAVICLIGSGLVVVAGKVLVTFVNQ